MAEPAAGSCGPAAAPPSRRPSEGSKEEERSPGGVRPAAQGVVSESDSGEKKVDPEQFLTPPAGTAVSKTNVSPHETTGAAVRKRSHESPSLRKRPLGPSPKRLSPWKSSPGKDHTSSSFNLCPRPLVTSPQAKRRSWCRSSLKGTKRRKSLPPVHQDVTELSKSISLDLPETERLSTLLLSSFQFSAQKFEHILKQTDGFSPEAFEAHVHSVSEDLKRYMQKLKRDGTLKSCVEDPKGILLDSAFDESVAQVKEYITRFAAECRSWDQLLLRYQESAEEMSRLPREAVESLETFQTRRDIVLCDLLWVTPLWPRVEGVSSISERFPIAEFVSRRQLEGRRRDGGRAEPLAYLHTSQAQVLRSKPDYQKILDEQGEVLSCMELVLDELQQAVKLLQAFSEDSRQYLRHLSEQLATRTFRQLENSPARKLIAAPPRRTPPAEG